MAWMRLHTRAAARDILRPRLVLRGVWVVPIRSQGQESVFPCLVISLSRIPTRPFSGRVLVIKLYDIFVDVMGRKRSLMRD